MPEPREVWITGVGILSSLGEGAQAHRDALTEGRVNANATALAPYVVHPLGPVDFDKQIPKKGDQRQMEPWQRIGTYAAGLALESAGVKGDAELLARMDLIVAAGGGERDLPVDSAILTGLKTAAQPEAFLNQRLMSDLRPTLFLAQLSNLLAGNISIVHGVTGSSRTFMGEEQAGVDALRIARARIAAGQSEIALAGGAYNAERLDMIMIYEFAHAMLRERHIPVWEREAGGMAFGSMGAFLVLEAREHAERRGAQPLARLGAVLSERSSRAPGALTDTLAGMIAQLAPQPGSTCAVVSGATGLQPALAEEQAALRAVSDAPVATGTYLGHGVEAAFPMNVALAALSVQSGCLFAPGAPASVRQAIVTSVGHWRGEGAALVEAVG